MRFILWASFEELLWQSHRQWKRNPSQAELNPQICCGPSVSSLQCTMCSLYSLSPFQPNKLRHILKFVSWYTIYQLSYKCPRLFGWKENMIFEETVSSSKFAIAILLYKQHIVQCTFLHPFKIRISYYSAAILGRRNSKLSKKIHIWFTGQGCAQLST